MWLIVLGAEKVENPRVILTFFNRLVVWCPSGDWEKSQTVNVLIKCFFKLCKTMNFPFCGRNPIPQKNGFFHKITLFEK